MDGWPLAEQIGGHLAVVIEARAGLQKASCPISAPREKSVLSLPSGLR